MAGTKVTTKKLVKMAMLVAISVVLVLIVHFPIFPAVPFLEYDPADIPILIGAFAYGPVVGIILTVVTAVIQGLTVSAGSGIYGIIMHIIATSAMVLTSSIIYSVKKTRGRAIVGLLLGIAAMVFVMFFANLLITPQFMGATVEQVMGMMVFILLFNLVKAGINSVVTFFLYKVVSPFLHK
ncbi:MAG: ECF transporter S component [Parasporobacterium sp.]|nr:ECF transporter S component [Parasporobacterium sp.]